MLGFKKMEIRQLELFLAVIDCASVTRAAEKLYVSPGAISMQLRSLAEALHTDLFVRSGRRLEPTPAALRLAEHARIVIRQMRDIEFEFDSSPASDSRLFHFATGATTLIYRLGRPLQLLRQRYPDTPIHITVSATEEMVAGLLARRFDLALITLPFPTDDLSVTPLFEEELLIVQHAEGPSQGWHVGNIKPAALSDAAFLLYPKRSNMRAIIDGFFAGIGHKPRVVMEADDTAAIRRLVESGFGYSILPETALRDQPGNLRVFRIPGHRMMRTQALAMVKTDHPRALTVAISKFLEQQIKPKNSSSR
ncbi:MAG: LysR family transcriptional regulator [Acidobacteriota bacterium]|nr:LysR family transcriptional regulator [Acidobacteriota bacterium]